MMIGDNIIKESKQAKNGDFLKRISTVVGLLCFTFLTGGVLASSAVRGATTNVEASVSVTAIACTFTGSGMDSHSAVLSNGLLSENIGTTTFSATCNDPGGFAIYAVGNSGTTEGTTSLVSSAGSSYNIATGTATSGETSNWAMKVTPTNGLTTVDNFSSYHAVPSSYTRVAEKASGALSGTVAVASSTYRVWTAPGQMTGNYTGQVKYTLVHPSTESCPEGYSLEGGICVKDPCNGAPKMQDITSSYISSMTTNTQVQMCDARDGKTYWVAKLADDKVWMTQNLDLVLSTSTTLTPSDSNVSSNWTPNNNTQTYQYKEADGTTIHSDAIWEDDYNTKAHSYRPASDPAAGTSGDYGNDGDTYYSPAYITNGTTMSSYKTEAECIAGGNTQSDCQHWSVGTLYSWYAATAGTGNEDVSTETNVTDSICPKGWHLPSSTDSGEFQALVTAAGLTGYNITASPYYFLRAGLYNGTYGAVYDTGDGGYYWSRMSYSATRTAYALYFDSSSVYPSYGSLRYYGFSIRCVAGS